MYYNNENLGATRSKKTGKRAKAKAEKPKKESAPKPSLVNSIDVSVKLLKRFKNFIARTAAGKAIKAAALATFIKALQKAIHETPIRKSDRYASEIEVVQRMAVNAFNHRHGVNVQVKAPAELFTRLKEISKSEKVRPSVGILKRVVGCVGLPYNEIAARLKAIQKSLASMYKNGLIKESDMYFEAVRTAERAVAKSIASRAPLQIHTATLNGLNGIIAGETGENF